MIQIDFFDAYGRFVVRHIIEFDEDCYYELSDAEEYIKRIFSWYKDAGSAVVLMCGITQRYQRYE
jgi:hypothetical protein